MSSMSPAGVETSPSIIQQALPSPITPITPAASWASPDDDPLERFVDNLSPGMGTPLKTSTPVPTQGNVAGVEPRCVPRQNTPSTPSDAGSRRISNTSGGSGGRRSGGSSGRQSGGSGGRRSGGRRGGGDSNGDDDDDDDNVEDSIPLDRLGFTRRRRRQ